MNSTKTRLEHLEHRVKELETKNKLLCEAVVNAVANTFPREELWAWLLQKASEAKGE